MNSLFVNLAILKPYSLESDIHCDLARLHLLHTLCWVTLGSPDWTLLLNACTVQVLTAQIMHVLEWVHNPKVK